MKTGRRKLVTFREKQMTVERILVKDFCNNCQLGKIFRFIFAFNSQNLLENWNYFLESALSVDERKSRFKFQPNLRFINIFNSYRGRGCNYKEFIEEIDESKADYLQLFILATYRMAISEIEKVSETFGTSSWNQTTKQRILLSPISSSNLRSWNKNSRPHKISFELICVKCQLLAL